jgi:SAM-dependent methyltransferase
MSTEPAPVAPLVAQSAHALGFTSHNVRLDDGALTYPRAGRTMDETGNYACVTQFLPVLFPEGWQGRSIVDLGCLEGGFAAEFARLGLAATGIDVRNSNIANAEYIRARVDLPNLRFVLDDAWNVARHGPFDIVFCVGLHYHIHDQHRFLAELGKACGKALYLDTWVAPDRDDSPTVGIYKLSELTTHEGVPGRWFPEHDLDAGADGSQLEALKWASWENRRSFWPTKGGLIQSMRDAGFTIVAEDFNQLGDDALDLATPEGQRYGRGRSVYWGIKT